jgi:hypothetical protein
MSDAMTPAEAERLIEADKRERAEAVSKIIQDALSAHRCELIGVPQIAPDGRIVALVQIVAR